MNNWLSFDEQAEMIAKRTLRFAAAPASLFR
jgi:hypothetical protein